MSEDPTALEAGQVVPVGPTAGRHTTLVVGYLDQDTSATALLAAGELADRLEATLHVVQVLDDLVPHGAAAVGFVAVPDGAVAREQVRSAGEEGRLQVAQLLEGSPVPWTWTTEVGRPADVLQQQAEEVAAYLIVLGLRERSVGSFVEHLLVGSTISGLRERTTRPLVLVPSARSTASPSAAPSTSAPATPSTAPGRSGSR